MNKLKIEIWSDVQCPFCYIGKHKFEKALDQFEHKDSIDVVWKSFQLNPNLETNPNVSTAEYLAKHKGISIEEAKQMGLHVAQAGSQIGLKFDFETVVLANTFNAHRILHFAEKKKVQNELKEALFQAHFVNGKNIDEVETLVKIGSQVGLDKDEIRTCLSTNQFANEVKQDIAEARQFGIQGVPFFVFDRKYAVSGAQDPSAFLQTLEKSFEEWHKENPSFIVAANKGESCDVNGNCD